VDENKQKGPGLRGFVSVVLMFSFLALALTGIVFLVGLAEKGFWGLDKEGWETMHINGSLLVLVAAVTHIVLNWKAFWGYLKKKGAEGLKLHWSVLVAIALVVIVMAATALSIPPFEEIHEWHEHMESFWQPPTAEQPGM
jgi:membrane protease YdiL (CAAX protease family)